MARRHVRLEVGAELLARRNPDGPVGGIGNPRTMTLERGPELGERARIRVYVFVVALGPDQDLARFGGRLLAGALQCCQFGSRWRSRRHVLVLLRVLRFGLVAP